MLRFDRNDLDWSYDLVSGWERAPEGLHHADVPAVVTDSDDNVYLFCRDTSQIVVYDRDGEYLSSWGTGTFSDHVHGAFMTTEDELLLVDQGEPFVARFTRSGELLQTIGPRGVTSDTGYDGRDSSTIVRAAGPFNRPAKAVSGPDGRLYVADGYGNARIHRFSSEGDWEMSWGEPGSGPGQFNVPHGLWIDGDTVMVTDRSNHRIQRFDLDGTYLSEWGDFYRPQDLAQDSAGLLYLAESAGAATSPGGVAAGRVSVLDREGNLLCRWSSGEAGDDDFMMSPHGICVDSEGSVYVGVNVRTAGRFYGVEGARPVLKFARVTR